MDIVYLEERGDDLSGRGAYGGTTQTEIITIVDKNEYQKLMQYVIKEDPSAFITVYNVSDMRYIPKNSRS